MSHLWLHTSECLLWCLVLQDLVRTPVLDVDWCVACLYPKKHQQVSVMNHGLSNPCDGLIPFLCKPILLWVVWNS
jgi:hypothetical protein